MSMQCYAGPRILGEWSEPKVIRTVFFAMFTYLVLTSAPTQAQGTAMPVGMHSGLDFDLQGIVCNSRYCSHRLYGLRWAMNTTGESVIWQHNDTRFLKIGYITLNKHLKQKNLLLSTWGRVKDAANPLALSRGYYFKYCDASSHTCEYLGDREYYTVADLERLFMPVMEVRQAFPVDIAGKLIERRNRIVVTALAVVGGFMVSKMTLSGVVRGLSEGVWEVLKKVFGGKLSAKRMLSAFKETLQAGANGDNLWKPLHSVNRALPRLTGYTIMTIAGWHNVKAWGWFSSESFKAKYYANNVKIPLLMSIPDMFVTSRKDKISIETLRDAFDSALHGDIGEFVAAYKEQQSSTAVEQDEESDR